MKKYEFKYFAEISRGIIELQVVVVEAFDYHKAMDAFQTHLKINKITCTKIETIERLTPL